MMAQEENYNLSERKRTEKEYHKKDDFKKYNKRSKQISAWQIQNLKFGAIVVRLQNNHLKIEACKKRGDIKLAKQVMAETKLYMRMMTKAYTENFDFCEVYFMYQQYSDSLFKGVRKGIFIDTTLAIDPSIEMKESYYLIAEKDYVYNSSVGFVKEDSANVVKESGNRTIEAPVVLKNKYVHQLKDPFPYYINRSFLRTTSKYLTSEKISFEGGPVEEIFFETSKENKFEKQEEYIRYLNFRLKDFYQKNQGELIDDKSLQPFLY